MKKLTILLFSILISFNSYGEWVKILKDQEGDTFYVETTTITKHNGYVYWWELGDYSTPTDGGDNSAKIYKQGDCGVRRLKVLSIVAYKQSMAKGRKSELGGIEGWRYPDPDNVQSTLLNYACNYVK